MAFAQHSHLNAQHYDPFAQCLQIMRQSPRRLIPSQLVILRIGCFHLQFGCSLADLIAFGIGLVAFHDWFVAYAIYWIHTVEKLYKILYFASRY